MTRWGQDGKTECGFGFVFGSHALKEIFADHTPVSCWSMVSNRLSREKTFASFVMSRPSPWWIASYRCDIAEGAVGKHRISTRVDSRVPGSARKCTAVTDARARRLGGTRGRPAAARGPNPAHRLVFRILPWNTVVPTHSPCLLLLLRHNGRNDRNCMLRTA